MTQKSFTTFRINLSQTQKEYFEQAAEVGGFKSLGDFILAAAAEKAEALKAKKNAWLSSEHDRKIFFNAILNPSTPNARLISAMKRHKEFNPTKY